jgi:peptide/nickel transport system substrate-binding protein
VALLRRVNRFAVCALVAGTIALSGCASRASARPDPNTIISITRTDGATMNTLFAQTVQDGLTYAQLLYESLSYIGADYLPHPRLATSWTHSDDGLHWTVDLRHGVRWSDGMPFTSKDVVFTYDAIIDPKTAAISSGDFAYIKKVTADGPYRVRFNLAYPSAVFTLTALGVEASILPEHILGKVPHEQLRQTGFGEHPVGTGPYRLERWNHDSETVFVRNPYAWRSPKIERIDVRTIFNDQSDAEAMANGSADLYDDTGSTIYEQLKHSAPNVTLMSADSVYIDVTLPNLRRPGLSDVIVRRAMMYGNDRASLISGLFDNKKPPPDGLVPVALKHWYTSDVRKYPYDPARARAMLDADGWRLGPDGIRRRGNQRLSFELLLNQGSVILTAASLEFVADMAAIGIDVALRQLDFPSMLSRQLTGNFDLVAEGFGGSVDPDMTVNLATASIPPNGANYGAFRDPAFDDLLKRALTELDDSKRQAMYYQMQREIAAQVPIFYQWERFAGLAHSQRLVLDPKTTLQSPLLYYNVEDWTVRQ